MAAMMTALHQESANRQGRMLFLEWESESAFYAAQGLLLHTPPENRDDAFWDRYHSYCKGVWAQANLGITAGLHLMLQAAADLTPALKFGGPAAGTNKAFLGVSNGSTAVTAADTDLSGTSKAYKGIDTGFPTEGTVSNKATLTWQATYGTTEAEFAWTEGGIFATSGTVPSAGSGASGVTTIPASSTPLAIALWTPSPLTKGSAIISQQYQYSVS